MNELEWDLVEAAQVTGRAAWANYFSSDEVAPAFRVALDIALAAGAYRVSEMLRREFADALRAGGSEGV